MRNNVDKQKHRLVPSGKLGLVLMVTILVAISIATTIAYYNHQAERRSVNEPEQQGQLKKAILDKTPNDHVYGAKDAKIQFVLYSDIHCQYCRSAYPKIKRAVDSFPPGTLSLVYRHIPIIYTHTEPTRAEIASECAAKDLGDAGFYRFLDLMFQALPANIQTRDVSDDLIIEVAKSMQIDAAQIMACVESGYNSDKIMADYKSGGAMGVIVLPHAFLRSDLGVYPISYDQNQDTYIAAVQYILNNPKE